MKSHINDSLQESMLLLKQFAGDDKNTEALNRAGDVMSKALASGNKVISCGNGGSMSDAMHFAEELTARFIKDRPALSAIAISDPGHLSCVANDFGYDYVFSRYVEAHGKTGDVLLAISTSGNSENVILAAKKARELGMSVVSLLGKDGGKLLPLSDVAIVVKSTTTARIQEIHIKAIHILIECIERSLFPKLY